MTTNKTIGILLLIFCMLLLSLIFSLLDAPPGSSSAYDLGYTTGAMFKNMLKILAALAIVWLVYRKMKGVKG
jgi:hypothetical protein